MMQDKILLRREIDDLLLDARGLVLVRRILADRGATPQELDAHTAALQRTRERLSEMIRGEAA
jgi:hypothetical protein